MKGVDFLLPVQDTSFCMMNFKPLISPMEFLLPQGSLADGLSRVPERYASATGWIGSAGVVSELDARTFLLCPIVVLSLR